MKIKKPNNLDKNRKTHYDTFFGFPDKFTTKQLLPFYG